MDASKQYDFIEFFQLILNSEIMNLKNHGLIDLTFNELHILLKINDIISKDEIPSPDKLLHELTITKSTLSTITNKLIKKKYLVKEKSIYDNRRIYFILKDKARYTIKVHNDWLKKAFDNVFEDQGAAQEMAFYDTIIKINKNLKDLS